jgi:hypothetical protein
LGDLGRPAVLVGRLDGVNVVRAAASGGVADELARGEQRGQSSGYVVRIDVAR